MNRRKIGLVVSVMILASVFVVSRTQHRGGGTLQASTETNVNHVAQTTVRVGTDTYDVELALTTKQQAAGLSNRNRLASNQGMLFVFKPAETPSFWMKEMKFPLDLVWIYQGKIVSISPNLPTPKPGTKPQDLPTYSPPSQIDYVLEINAGAAKDLAIGDHFEIVDSQQVFAGYARIGATIAKQFSAQLF